MPEPLDYVAGIKPYVPGKPLQELERELGLMGSIKLASNENPLGPSKKVLAALKKSLEDGQQLSRYPEGSGYYLKNALSDKLSRNRATVSPDEILLGNGSNELLNMAVRTFVGRGDEAIMATPSFVVYAMAVQAVGAVPIEIPLVDYRHNLVEIAKAISNKTKMVFIANPNNPTGTINKGDEFEKFMESVPESVIVVIDEAYFEYVTDPEYPDTMRYLKNGRDVLILRTFSKAYGLAGLRIGYGISQQSVFVEMNKIREPFNTNTLAQLAALAALEDEEHLRSSVAVNEEGKEFLSTGLGSLGLAYVPTQANFIYVPLPVDSKVIYDALLHKGVVVRPVGKKEIRVTIGLPEENKRFIEALRTSIQ